MVTLQSLMKDVSQIQCLTSQAFTLYQLIVHDLADHYSKENQ